MRVRVWTLLALLLAALPAAAQETRGNINGTVQDRTGVVPGATVRVTNTETSGTVQLVTNSQGYFEAVLLNPGTYAVRVEMSGFKTLSQTGITLGASQTLSLTLTLDVGQVSEQVDVVAEAPILDTTTVSSGQNFDRRMVESLPMFSNMPIMLSRFTPGVAPADTDVQNIFQGYMEGTTSAAGGQVGTGSGFDNRNTGNNYTIDGVSNNGFGRRIASSPNADQIEEMRVETSNFDASQGKGTGLSISMMTRGGTNTLRGSVNYTHWNNRFNSPNLQQKATFLQDPRQEDSFRQGRSHIGAFTLGGPINIPKVYNGSGKAFYFFNFSKSSDSAPGRLAANSTVPANRAHLDGNFSDLLLLPSGATGTTAAGHHQYQIYDPLTARPDPNRPGRIIRTPFPNNIIPRDRIFNPDGSYRNPAFGLYQAMVPEPNQNFLSPTQQPTNNYFRSAEPDQPHNTQASLRVDYNRSENSRFFVRGNGNKFLESSLSDWTYDSPDPQFRGLHDVARSRFSWSTTGTWTRVVRGNTVFDTQIAAQRAHQRDLRKNLINYKPSSVGLPGYLDEYCQARLECILPQTSIGGYQAMGGNPDRGIWVTTYQGQTNFTSTRGAHTWRGGLDIQVAQRTAKDGAGNMGTFNYDNQYTRATDEGTSNVYPSQNIGLSLAAFMMGMPSSVSIAEEKGFNVKNNYYGTFVQDTWRVNRNLTLNIGLRYEYENGIKEQNNRALLWFDPDAELAISAIAEAAYALNPQAGMPASQFDVRGGTVYAGTPGYDNRSWKPESLWMPRFSFGYKVGEKNVIKGGFGVYYDTLNARDWTPNLEGYNVTTSNPLSTDFGQNFLLGNPRAGILPLADPFPVKATGSRYESLLENALGYETMLGRGFTAENPNRVHSRVQRWRLGWQRELDSRTAIDIAYSGSYADRQGIGIRQDYLPEEYWITGNVRNNTQQDFLTANVPNPFNIANFAVLQTTNPLLYQRLQGSTTFTSATIQRNRLLRMYPQMTNITFNDQPLQVIKSHSLDIVVNRRYSNGLSGNAALSFNRVTENRTVEEYDRAPTLWQTNNNGRPWRFTTAAVYELPFGPDKPFLSEGGTLSQIARGWTLGSTFEYQPGALINWGNLFFNGNLSDIKKSNPEIALLDDGTFDPTKTWFNTEAGFEKATAAQPTTFHKRVFPFRVDGVRNQSVSYLHANISRTFDLGNRRSFNFRVDIQNLLNRQHFGNPNLDPTNTNFGQVRAVTQAVMRFITFNTTFRF